MNLMNEILFYLITFVKNYSIQYSKSFFRNFFFDLIIYLMIYIYKTKLISLKIFYLEHIFYKELLDISKIKT